MLASAFYPNRLSHAVVRPVNATGAVETPRFGGQAFYTFDESTPEAKAQEQNRLRDVFQAAVGRISAQEAESVDHYTSSGREVNGLLRIQGQSRFSPRGDERANILRYFDVFPERRRIISDLDGLIARGRMPFDAVVYRGIRSGIRLDQLSEGQTLQEPGFLSTSPFLGTASQWFARNSKRDGSGNFIFRIKVAKGTPCLDPNVAFSENRLSELIFPRNGRLHIDRIMRPSKIGQQTIVDATLSY